MLHCIDPENTKLIAQARADEVVERIRDALIDVDGDCMRAVAAEVGLPYHTLYAFKKGKTEAPHFSTLQKLLAYFAPGYEIAVAPIDTTASACVMRRPPTIVDTVHDGVVWCVPMQGGKVVGKAFRKVAIATVVK